MLVGFDLVPEEVPDECRSTWDRNTRVEPVCRWMSGKKWSDMGKMGGWLGTATAGRARLGMWDHMEDERKMNTCCGWMIGMIHNFDACAFGRLFSELGVYQTDFGTVPVTTPGSATNGYNNKTSTQFFQTARYAGMIQVCKKTLLQAQPIRLNSCG